MRLTYVAGCKKGGLVVDSLVSGIDVTKCSSIQIQLLGAVPSITMDHCDGGEIYLSESSLDVEIVTSSCSGLNVS